MLSAHLPFAAWRNEPRRWTMRIVGMDLTGKNLRMQVRLAPNTPGAPLIDLVTVANADLEGLTLVSVAIEDGVPVSTVAGFISKATMSDAAKLPYSGELGAHSVFSYAVQIDNVTRIFGPFTALAAVIDSDDAPSGSSYNDSAHSTGSGSVWGNAQLTFGNDLISVSIEGTELLGVIVKAAENQAALAAASAGVAATHADTAAAHRLAAEGFKVAADAAQAQAKTYSDTAGNSATAAAGHSNTAATHAATANTRQVTATAAATAAEGYRDQVQTAIAAAAGPTLVYATKAEANEALPGLPDNQVVQVFADETRGDRWTVYRKEAGALVRKADPWSGVLRQITPAQYGALGDGVTDDAAALAGAATAASALGVELLVNSRLTITTTVTISVPVIVSGAGEFTGGGRVNFNRGLTASAQRRIFADGFTAKIATRWQPAVFVEWWGGAPMGNPRSKDVAANVDSTSAWQKALTCGYNTSTTDLIRYAVKVVALGWYMVTDQITVDKTYFKIIGKNPSFGGTGFRWAGAPVPGWASKAIIKITGAQFSTIEDMGFKGIRSSDPSTRLRAAIWTHWDVNGGQDTQRRLTFRNMVVGDNLGSWTDTDPGYEFTNGILSGGATNGNDDFHTVDHLITDSCVYGIRQDQSMAVQWDIRQYQFQDGRIMFYSTGGGSVIGRDWFPARSTREGVFRFTQPSNSGFAMYLEIEGFDSEHMEGGYLISSNMPVRGKVQAKFISFTMDPPNGTIQQNGNSLTTSSGISEFFAPYMIGQKFIFADGQEATVTAVAANGTSATVSDSKTVALQDARLTDLQGFRRPYLLHAYEATAHFQVEIEGCKFQLSSNFGTPNPGGSRIALLQAPNVTTRHHVTLTACSGIVWGLIITGGRGPGFNQSRIVDIELVNCNISNGGWEVEPLSQSLSFVGSYGQDADGIISLGKYRQGQHVQQMTRGAVHHFGAIAGSIPISMVTKTVRGVAIAAKVLTVADVDGTPLLQGKRSYLGASFFNQDANFTRTSGLFGVAIGTSDSPFRFGFLPNATTGSQVTGLRSLGGVYYPSFNTALQIRGLYSPSGTLSQSGTTVTASSSTAFAATGSLDPALLVGSKIYWRDAAGNVAASATVTAVASDNTLTVSETQSVAGSVGAAMIEYPVTAGKRFGISLLGFAADDLGFYEIDRFGNSTPTAMVS